MLVCVCACSCICTSEAGSLKNENNSDLVGSYYKVFKAVKYKASERGLREVVTVTKNKV